MLTLALYGLLAIVIMGVLFLIATRLLPPGEQIAPPIRDEAPWALPATQAMTAQDVTKVRLPVALRGYRFAETDLLLDRLAEELRARDEEIARLRGERPASEGTDGTEGTEGTDGTDGTEGTDGTGGTDEGDEAASG